jgi:hypothetical protein
MRYTLIILCVFSTIGFSQTKPVSEFPQWKMGKPSKEDVSQKIEDRKFAVLEFISVKLIHEQKGEDITVDKLETGGFATLFLRYDYLYNFKFGSSPIDFFTLTIPLQKQGEKIQELEIVTYTIDTKGELQEVKAKNVVRERKKIDNDKYVMELKLQNIAPESFYQISYNIKSANLSELKPRVLEGDLHERMSRFKMEVPDFLKVKSNYDSLGYYPNEVSDLPFWLETFSYKDVGRHNEGGSGHDIFNAKVYKWIFDEPTDFFSKVYFDVNEIDIPPKNKYGLHPGKFKLNNKADEK